MNWDYIAGFVDGEGSIVKRKEGYNLLISQTNFEVLESIRNFVGSGYVYALGKRKNHWKDAWLYSAGGHKETYFILTQIVNKLIVKKKEALAAIKKLELRLDKAQDAQRLKQQRITEARRLRKMGWSYRRIAEKLNTDFGYIRRLILSEQRMNHGGRSSIG